MDNELKLLLSAYIGIENLDEYELKVYILKDLKELIDNYLKEKNIKIDLDYEKRIIENEEDFNIQLQDALLVLPRIKAPLELTLLINQKLKNN